MITFFNRSPHNPPHSYGDCFRACLSSILETPTPHFMHDGCDGDEKNTRVNEYLSERGLAWIEIPFKGTKINEALEWGGHFTLASDIHWILGGCTKDDVGHYIVCRGNRIVHNPNEKSEIIKPHADGYYWFGCIALLK